MKIVNAHQMLAVVLMLLLSACSTLYTRLPKPTTLEERLQAFQAESWQLEKPVKIYWSKWGVPHIVAQNDQDLAYGQGLVHAHLRAGQMELFRRLASGRLSESVGFVAKDIDQALRVLGLGRAIPQMKEALPSETRKYLEAYVRGFNDYMRQSPELPHDFKVLNWDYEPWTLEDVLLISRLAAIDVNWISIGAFLSRGAGEEAQEAVDLIRSLSRFHKSGSNSWVLSGQWTKSGKPLIANDPHLGFTTPNLWLLVGLKSPGIETVGFSIPGLPIVALGRNRSVSWGGTNMRSLSTDLVELSEEDIAESVWVTERLKIRLGWDTDIRYRISPHGPIVNDVAILDELPKTYALKWRGHQASDEITSFLRAMKSTSVKDFQDAFVGYAVSGQNFVAADSKGNIGLVRAVELPNRNRQESYPAVSSERASKSWAKLLGSDVLPQLFNPSKGYIASANDEPEFETPVLGFDFSPPQRKLRIDEWMEARIQAIRKRKASKVDVKDFQALQMDTFSQMSWSLKNELLERDVFLQDRSRELLKSWDAHYRTTSTAAVFFQAYIANINSFLLPKALEQSISAQTLMQKSLASQAQSPDFVAQSEKAELKAWKVVKKFPTWGDFHRMSVAHPLGNAPLIGSKYRFDEFGVAGGVETLFKTAHGLTDQQHTARYGAQARHISDLADVNKNYFVLFGGNDAWFFSENHLDQVPLWREGELIEVPLESGGAKENAVFTQELSPTPRR